MTLNALIISCVVGVIFTVIWGVLVYVASNGNDFKSLFLGGLANFVFFIGGLFASYPHLVSSYGARAG